MPPQAASLEQLERWLVAYYSEKAPEKLENVPKIARKMLNAQLDLDAKLKAAYGKGLRYAATLAGDYRKEPKRKHEDSGTREIDRPMKKISSGVKRFAGTNHGNSNSSTTTKTTLTAKAAFTTNNKYGVDGGSSGSSSSGGGTSSSTSDKKKRQDIFALNDEQKEFLKRVKAENLRIEYEQDNPKKFGTMSWERYERYKKANTVAEMIDLGGKVADVAFDYSRGYIYVPDGGQFATFQLQTLKLKSVYVPPQKKQKASHEAPSSSLATSKKMASSPSFSSAPSFTSFPPTSARAASTNAWEVGEEDKSNALDRTQSEGAEAAEIEALDTDGCRRLETAYTLYGQGSYEGALQELTAMTGEGYKLDQSADEKMARARSSLVSAARRFTALVRMRLRGNETLSSILQTPGAQGRGVSGKSVQIADELPEFCPDQPKRDLAKETRSELQRHETKGIGRMFDARLKEILDDLTHDHLEEAEDSMMKVKYHFKDDEEYHFMLHKSTTLPGHSNPVGEFAKMKRRKGGGLRAMFALITSGLAEGTLEADTVSNFINRYSAQGATALALAARAGGDPTTFVYPLLKLGADPVKSMEGAIYLAEKREDTGWFMALLQALRSAPDVTPETFRDVITYTRRTGETALIIAVGKGDTKVVRTLLEWGSQVESPGQKTAGGESCIQVAQRLGSADMIALLEEHM